MALEPKIHEGHFRRVSSGTPQNGGDIDYDFVTLDAREIRNVRVPKHLKSYFDLALGKPVGFAGVQSGGRFELCAIREADGRVQKVSHGYDSSFLIGWAAVHALFMLPVIALIMFIPSIIMGGLLYGPNDPDANYLPLAILTGAGLLWYTRQTIRKVLAQRAAWHLFD